MELAGEEKRIQALFSELSLRDHSLAPGFERLWTRAEMVGPAPVRDLRKSLLVLTSVLVIVAGGLLGAWSLYRSTQSSTRDALNIPPQPVSPPSSPLVQSNRRLDVTVAIKYRHERQKRFARLRRIDRATIDEAALISRWQSPTQTFMDSPAAARLNSLPQLNQSVEELKLFLPQNTELTKESNQ